MCKVTATGTSKEGFNYEDVIVDHLIKNVGGRESFLSEQVQEQIDYIDSHGNKYDVKYQPKAWDYGTINVELCEFNPNNPTDTMDSWLFTSTAETYLWSTGEHLLAFNKELIYNIGYAYYKSDLATKIKTIREYKEQGFTLAENGSEAQQMSSDFKVTNSSRRSSAKTLRVPIQWLLDNGAIDLYKETTDFKELLEMFPPIDKDGNIKSEHTIH